MLWFWIDFVWFRAHQLSVKLARSTRCELCDAISYIGLLWFLRIWFKLFLILKNFDGLYICNFFFFFFLLWKFVIFLRTVLLIPNSTWRTLLAIQSNKAYLLTNSISLETSPIDFKAYSFYFYLLFGIQSIHIREARRRKSKLRYKFVS